MSRLLKERNTTELKITNLTIIVIWCGCLPPTTYRS